MEDLDVVNAFTDSDIFHGHLEGVADSDHDTTLGGSVKLGDGKRVDIGGGDKLLRLFVGILTGGTVKNKEHFLGSVGHYLLHHTLGLGEFLHQTGLVVESAGCVDEHHIHIVGFRGGYSVECHSGGVAPFLLFDHRYADSLSPEFQLGNRCLAECVGGSDHHFVACLLVLVGKFANGGGLAYTVDTHYHYYVGLFILWDFKVSETLLRFFGFYKHIRDLFAEKTVELGGTHIFVAGGTIAKKVDDFEGGIHSDVACDKRLLKVVEHLVVYLALACHGMCEFVKKTGFGLFKTGVEFLFIFLSKNLLEESHISFDLFCKINTTSQNYKNSVVSTFLYFYFTFIIYSICFYAKQSLILRLNGIFPQIFNPLMGIFKKEIPSIKEILDGRDEQIDRFCRLCAIIDSCYPDLRLEVSAKELLKCSLSLPCPIEYNWYYLIVRKDLTVSVKENYDNADDKEMMEIVRDIIDRYNSSDSYSEAQKKFEASLISGDRKPRKTGLLDFIRILLYLLIMLFLGIILYRCS